MEEIFTKIYDKKIWGGGSGSGSKMTADNLWFIDLLGAILDEHKIKKVVDIGCGDYNILKNIDWNGLGIEYNGIDCVEDLITFNNQEFGNEFIKFRKLDISKNPHLIQEYDLVILKDVIQHWNNETIEVVFHQLVENNKLVLIGNGYKFGRTPEKNNWKTRDINNKYSYHPVDIEKEPLKSMNLNVILKEHRRYKQFCLIK
jgi:2-polyprenyl-3-methyl-5-hydroxy-6-metoxy-1,4-benzoquinol methylase